MTKGATECSRNLSWTLKDEEDSQERAMRERHSQLMEEQVQRQGGLSVGFQMPGAGADCGKHVLSPGQMKGLRTPGHTKGPLSVLPYPSVCDFTSLRVSNAP